MRILHIDETFHPNFGYHCNPLAKYQKIDGNEVFIIAPEKKYIYSVYKAFNEYGESLEQDDKNYEERTGVIIKRVHANGKIAGRLNYNMPEIIETINEINPDAILVHCIETLTAMRLMHRLKRKYPMVFDSHMLSMASRNKFVRLYEIGYRLLCTTLIKKEKYVVIKTQNDEYVTSHLGIPSQQTKFISFGTDILTFCPNKDVRHEFFRNNKLPEDTFIIVSTGKLSQTKGGMLLADTVLKKFNTDRHVAVLVVANYPGEYEKEVKRKLEQSENQVFYYPVQNYMDLAKFYQIADVAVFPKQCSMSFYDAQSCGCPVISEKGHVNEDRNSHNNGLNFDRDSIKDFRSKLEELMNMPREQFEIMKHNSIDFIKKNYSYDLIAKQYSDELKHAYESFNRRRSKNK